MSLYENSLQLFANSIHLSNSKCESKFFKNLLNNGFTKEHIKKLCVTLKKSGAVIAGGGVLSAFKNFALNDLDIYVNKSNLPILVKFIENDLGNYNLLSSCIAPAYDLSFFRKNNILSRFHFESELELPSIDVMIIPDDIDIISVVSNFDLSFCEIWFDGENVVANDPEGINISEGYLKEDYLESVFKYFNRFIIKRIKKYSKRGFKIATNCNKGDVQISSLMGFFGHEQKTIYTKNGDITIEHDDGTIVYPEEYVVKHIYNKLFPYMCENDINLYQNFILSEFKVEKLFDILSRFYHIKNGSLWFVNNAILINRPEPNDDFRERIGGFLGGLKPEIEKLRIGKKIKLLIKYFILRLGKFGLNDDHDYLEEPWDSYFNAVLNKDLSHLDIENEAKPDFTGEKFFINFSDYDNIQDIDKSMLAEILFLNNLDDFREISYIRTENYTDENGNRRTREVIRTEYIFEYGDIIENIKNYYYNINQRKNMNKVTSFCIPRDMQIQEMEDFTMTSIPGFLSSDENNFVIIYDSKSSDSFNGFEGVGLSKKSLYETYNRIILECNQEYTGAITTDRVKNLKELYLLLGIGTSLNCGLSLSVANTIKDLIHNKNERVFYVSDEKLLNNIVALENLIIDTEYSTNMMGVQVNYISGTHCNPDTQTNVYQTGYIIDYESLKKLKDVQDYKDSKNHIIIYDDSSDNQELFNISGEDYEKIFKTQYINKNTEENQFLKMLQDMEEYSLVFEYIFNSEILSREYTDFIDYYERNGFIGLTSEYENNPEFKNKVDKLYSDLKLTFNKYIDEKDKDLEINNLEREERTNLFNDIFGLLTYSIDRDISTGIEAREILQSGISNYSTRELREFLNTTESQRYLEENMSEEEDDGYGNRW